MSAELYYECCPPRGTTITDKPRYPSALRPLRTVTEPAVSTSVDPASTTVTPLPPSPSPSPTPRRSALPDDLLLRSEEEGARRLALKALGAAKAAERRLDDRFDREALHDFRVAIRRLRSVLRAYKVPLKDVVGTKDRRKLRDIQRATGAGREAEVALDWLTKQQSSLQPQHLPGLNWLSASLLERRRRCSADLDREVRESFRRNADKLEARLAVMTREQNLLAEEATTSFARCVSDLVEAHATDLLLTLGQAARLDDAERLHDGRIAGKRLRYLLEPLRPFVNESQKVVKYSKRLQDVLGDLNDVHVLLREIDLALGASMQQRTERIRASIRLGDLERTRRDAMMTEWPGLLELHRRLDEERRLLVGKLRDRWLDGELQTLVARTRDLAQRFRAIDRGNAWQ